ncbi:hypothetical protein SAMN02745126_04388 [Enhydrobacter aerosaccus]|uniref:PXPV repeat-containing protein n=1 Tax=Enhydrobacter aerosaccus TaxID=225324 RepID=A0A1T4S7R5_9HYPH|nr:hypothetical protein [Enhydrobacter aerosaccus]SKA24283.1 hypothetical protein SAMN02745126_04388 [Enhydrobacter aerosaccus]
MRIVTKQRLKKLSIAAVLFGSVVVAFAGGAQADDPWDHDRGWDRHREHEWREHEWREHEWREHHAYYAPRYVEQRPVYVAPPPVVYAPPAYAAPMPSSLNLNFNIPLQ